jgi:hypothetical protein
MQLLVAVPAEAHPALEKASWIVAIVAFGLVILQLLFYWFGRHVPLHVRASGQTTKDAHGRDIVLVDVECRSRTRDAQTVRELLLFAPPNALSRVFWPTWYTRERPVVPCETASPPLPFTIDGHDTRDVRLAFLGNNLPFGEATRLKVRASLRRPHVASISMRNGA